MRVVDIDVALFVRGALAALPAAIILGIIGFFVTALSAAMFGNIR